MHAEKRQRTAGLWCLLLVLGSSLCTCWKPEISNHGDLTKKEQREALARATAVVPTNYSWVTSIEKDLEKMGLEPNISGSSFQECLNGNGVYFSSLGCYCDDLCLSFGDCCPHYLPFLSQEKLEENSKNYTCQRVSLWDDRQISDTTGVYVVKDCPATWGGTDEDDLCRRNVSDDAYKVILDIPVASSSTGLAYENYFCALCHDDVDSLVEFNITVTCFRDLLVFYSINGTTDDSNESEILTPEQFFSEANYAPRQKMFRRTVENSIKTEDCPIKILGQGSLNDFARRHRLRLCYITDIRKCDPSWKSIEDVKKCNSYSFASSDFWTIYKNPHCARCNFINTSLITTRNYVNRETSFTSVDSNRIPTLSIIFNLNTYCLASDEVWYKVTKRCEKLVCGSGYQFSDGSCKKVVLFSPYSGNKTAVNDSSVDCPRIALDDFVMFSNGSVYSPRHDQLFFQEEYQLTNDSGVLICAEQYYGKFSDVHRYTTLVVLAISLVFLAFHIIFYCCFARMRTWHSRNLLCLCCSLFVAQLLFLTGPQSLSDHGACVFLSVCLHYFWLVSFFWMNILSLDVWNTFRCHLQILQKDKTQTFLLYNLYAWGIPAAIVTIGLLIDLLDLSSQLSPKYGSGFKWRRICWINSRMGLVYFFLLPVGVIILENLVLFIMTSKNIYKQSKEARFANTKSQSTRRREEETEVTSTSEHERGRRERQEKFKKRKIRFSLYVKLGVLQGFTWVSWFVASFSNSSAWWFIFTVVNGLQGAAIFIAFDLRWWVLKMMWNRLKQVFQPFSLFKKDQNNYKNKRREFIELRDMKNITSSTNETTNRSSGKNFIFQENSPQKTCSSVPSYSEFK